ncbi:hypothetical protein TTHT_1328 [Thermotomaculum hydrothermale]|uniref:Type II and III secretion system protein n=1 Tax=Thermotomaculum hydrothermale TaxID=981385 RepID=A0A7R6PMI8_9BACT|nr:secretin N-terminal domain-containing protein [Thermotomaculum hydrothermale]BBB32842.1 hypothetical protein TTHT_1328 [Thermotomaculum hydrothermale]
MKKVMSVVLILILTGCVNQKPPESKPEVADLKTPVYDIKVLDVKKFKRQKQKKKKEEKKKTTVKVYTGKKVSFSFYKADIHDFFRAISEVAGVSFLVHDNVKGEVTIDVKDVPWDQLLDTVLEFNKLTMIKKGKIIEIIPRELADKTTEVIKLNYTKAKDVVKIFKDNPILGKSEGTIVPDETANALIVTDIPENIEKIKKIVSQIDVKPKQVLLESIIAEVTLNDNNKLGIGWQFGEDGRIRNSWGDTSFSSSGSLNFPLNDVDEGTGFSYALSVNDDLVKAQLNAYAQANKAKILSHPKIVTYNNHKAEMKVVERRWVQTSVNTNAAVGVGGLFTNFEERDYGIILKVTPHINENGDIVLEIDQEVSDLIGVDNFGNPIAIKRNLTTTILLKNGQTMVLGGLIQEKNKNEDRGIPKVNKIPILKHIFGTGESEKKRTELLLFITPHLIEDFSDAKAVTDTMLHQDTALKPLDSSNNNNDKTKKEQK